MEWIVIISALMETFGPMIADCLDDDDDDGVARIRRFGRDVRSVVKATARQEGRQTFRLRGRKLRKFVDRSEADAREMIAAASDEEVREFIQECRDCKKAAG